MRVRDSRVPYSRPCDTHAYSTAARHTHARPCSAECARHAKALLINEFAHDINAQGDILYYAINGSACASSLPLVYVDGETRGLAAGACDGYSQWVMREPALTCARHL